MPARWESFGPVVPSLQEAVRARREAGGGCLSEEHTCNHGVSSLSQHHKQFHEQNMITSPASRQRGPTGASEGRYFSTFPPKPRGQDVIGGGKTARLSFAKEQIIFRARPIKNDNYVYIL